MFTLLEFCPRKIRSLEGLFLAKNNRLTTKTLGNIAESVSAVIWPKITAVITAVSCFGHTLTTTLGSRLPFFIEGRR